MKFDDALNVPPSEVKSLYDGVMGRVDRKLNSLGIPSEPDTPTYNQAHYNGQLPSDLDALTYSELTNLLAANVGWTRYLNHHRTNIENHLTVCSRQLDALKASLIKKKGKDVYKSDRRYIVLDVDVAELECLLRCLDTALQVSKDGYKLLSRAVTIRGQDQERVQRHDNVSKGFFQSNGRSRG